MSNVYSSLSWTSYIRRNGKFGIQTSIFVFGIGNRYDKNESELLDGIAYSLFKDTLDTTEKKFIILKDMDTTASVHRCD